MSIKLNVCEFLDPKGLYSKARKGEIQEFTGISSPYEEPLTLDLVIETDLLTIEESAENINSFLQEKEII